MAPRSARANLAADVADAAAVSPLDGVFTLAVLVAAVLGIGLSLAQARVQRGSESSRSWKYDDDDDDEAVKWSLMGLVSCLPWLNCMSWLVLALEGDDSEVRYYVYSIIYALPLLRNGLEIDAFTLTMLFLGAIHVQAERIALTEPDTLPRILPPSGGSSSSQVAETALKTATSAGRAALAAGRDAMAAAQRAVEENKTDAQERVLQEELQDAAELNRAEMAEWDARLHRGSSASQGSSNDRGEDDVITRRSDADIARGDEGRPRMRDVLRPSNPREERSAQSRRDTEQW